MDAPLSFNAAVFATVLLASRLQGTLLVFALLCFSVDVFALFPVARHHIKVSWPSFFAFFLSYFKLMPFVFLYRKIRWGGIWDPRYLCFCYPLYFSIDNRVQRQWRSSPPPYLLRSYVLCGSNGCNASNCCSPPSFLQYHKIDHFLVSARSMDLGTKLFRSNNEKIKSVRRFEIKKVSS